MRTCRERTLVDRRARMPRLRDRRVPESLHEILARVKAALCALLVLTALTACSGEDNIGGEWTPGGRVAPPEEIVALLRDSSDATLYRVTGEYSDDFEEHKTRPKISGHPKIAEKPLPAEARREIARILADRDNYLRENETWTCLPQPFYLIQTRHPTGTVNVVVHECGDIELHSTIAGKTTDWQHGLRVSSAESRLWTLLRRVIPARPNCCGET